MADYSAHLPFARKACTFFTASPDPFHVVANNVSKLLLSGFKALTKKEPFELSPGGKYFYTLNRTTLVAFTVGSKYAPGNGFKIIGGHTDTPNLKVKPRSKRSASGCTQLAVEAYGGGLWHTWFDRDLGISGRVLVRSDGKIEQKMVMVRDPVARVSTLCIHLQTAEERSAFKVNKEDHLSPVLGTQSILQDEVEKFLTGDSWADAQEPMLMRRIAKEVGVKVEDIADFELNLFDVQPAAIGGMNQEFLYSARLDNHATCFVSIEALIAHAEDLGEDEDVSLVALFDHEEVGSQSAIGAGSPVMSDAVESISKALGDLDPRGRALARSFIFSVDQAHAVHPNYAAKHEKNHAPKMNNGVVLKINSNQRYTTNSVTGFIVREISRKAGLVPMQDFVVRNDCPCGSTIGPIVSGNTGIRTVDAGMPQLSMHSCREVMGIADLSNGLELFMAFFKHFREIDDKLEE